MRWNGNTRAKNWPTTWRKHNMTYSNDWAITDNPADHSKFKDQPSHVRKVRTDLQERLADLLYGFTSGETTVGLKKILLNNQASDPSAPTDAIALFGKKAYVFTVSGITTMPTAGATYTNNTKTFTVLYASATTLYCSGTGEPAASGDLTKASGTGDATIAFSAMTSKAEVYVRHESAGVKLLTSAGKLIAATLTSLETLAADAGVIPAANLPAAAPAEPGGVLGSYKNLKIVRTSVTQVTVTADELILEDTDNVKAAVRAVSQVAAITTSGAGGLDTGAEGNVWYYIWIIRKSSDGTVAALLSASATAPTMPSGYDQKAVVGAVKNTAGDFENFWQTGRYAEYEARAQILNSGGAGSFTDLDVSGSIPIGISDKIKCCCHTNNNGSGSSATYFRKKGSSNDESAARDQGQEDGGSGGTNTGISANEEILTDENGVLQYKTGYCQLWSIGYYITKLS